MGLNAWEELSAKRRELHPLLSRDDPADALAWYYALAHDPRRTRLVINRDAQGRADGFAVACQTGADLFRPLVTLRAPDTDAAGRLLREALSPSRPYYVTVPVTLAAAVREHLNVEQARVLSIYRLEPTRFQPIVNVMVQRVQTADGAPRFQIESQGQVVAVSGLNWRSPVFAEIFVYVYPGSRHRGWGRSVASACTSALIEARLRPLYMVEAENTYSVRIAEALGYVDTGLREFAAEGRLK